MNANRGGGANGTNGRNKRNADSQHTPELMATLKEKFPFHRCHLYEHSANVHNPDETLKPGAKSYQKLSRQNTNNSHRKDSAGADRNRKKPAPGFTSSFVPLGNETLKCNTTKHGESEFEAGTLVDYGPPYSAIGETELLLLRDCTPSAAVEIVPKPD